MTINDRMRGFAQGILIEAIDTTYAIGFVEVIHKTFNLQPPVRLKKILINFGKRAVVHWFKHVKAKDLNNPKVYNFVRTIIGNNFRKTFEAIANDLVFKKPHVVVVAYRNPIYDKGIWG